MSVHNTTDSNNDRRDVPRADSLANPTNMPPNPKTSGKPRKLTIRQERFVRELPTAESQADAARKAGYDCTDESARVIASQNLTKLNVQQAIQAQQDAIAAENAITHAEVAAGLRRAAAGAELKQDWSAAGSNWEKLGKLGGLFVDLFKDVTARSDSEIMDELLTHLPELLAYHEQKTGQRYHLVITETPV